jgi:hypothetical protein
MGGDNMITLEEAVKGNNIGGAPGFQQYFSERGFSKITIEDLEAFIEYHSTQVFGWKNFMEIYIAKQNEKSAKIMEKWTVRVGWMTVVMLLVAVIQVFKS